MRMNWDAASDREMDLADPTFWQAIFVVDAEASVTKSLAFNQVAGMLAGMVAQGVLIDSGDAYTWRSTTKMAKYFLNDQATAVVTHALGSFAKHPTVMCPGRAWSPVTTR